MLAFDFEQLSALGLTPALANRAAGMAASDGASFELLRITVVHRATIVVHDGVNERSVRPLPRLVRALNDEGTALAVGDWVLAAADVRGETWIATLTNTLLGTAVQDTGPVRVHDGRGMHTTTSRSLHRLPGGACVIDTPGLRALRPDSDEASLAASFDDIEALAARCRFRDCAHMQEPGCAVREGIGADRLRNYHKLLREMRRDTLTALDRQRQRAEWKARPRRRDTAQGEARRSNLT